MDLDFVDADPPFLELTRDYVIPLPHWRINPTRDPGALFKKDDLVLALFPGTTVFYKGYVQYPPVKADDEYLIRFYDWDNDTAGSDGQVPPRYVVAFHEPPASSTRRKKMPSAKEDKKKTPLRKGETKTPKRQSEKKTPIRK